MGVTTKLVAAGAAALLCAFALWRLAGEDAERAARPASPPAAETARGDGAALAPRRRSGSEADTATATGAAATPSETPSEAESGAVVEGVVEGPEGARIEGGRVYVAAEVQGERRIVASQELLQDGSFRVVVEDSFVGGGLAAEVGAAVSGLRREVRALNLRSGEAQRASFRLERGAAISGVVVTADGTPVPGLQLLVYRSEHPPRVVTEAMLDVDALLARPFAREDQFALARTDAAGRFEAAGLGDGPHAVVTDAAAWILRTDGPIAAGTTNARVVATRARSAIARVRSAADGSFVAATISLSFEWRTTRGRTRTQRAFDAPGGVLTFRWARDEALSFGRDGATLEDAEVTEFAVSLDVVADGFHARSVTLAEDDAPSIVDIELDPVDDATVGRLRLEVVDARGEPVDEELQVTLYDPGPEHASPTTSRLSKQAPGRYVLAATPGKWKLVLLPEGMPIADASATRDVELVAGAALDLRAQLPPIGRLTLRRGAKGTGKLEVSVGDASGNSCGTTIDAEPVTWRLLAGRWTVLVGEGPTAKRREVEVSAFEETVVDVDE